MDLFKQWEKYVAYVRDNPHGYWFKRKWYGWGWTPVTWQGWLVILVFLGVVMLNSLRFALIIPDLGETVIFLAETFGSVFVVMWICYKKGETPRWQWGPPKEYDAREEEKRGG